MCAEVVWASEKMDEEQMTTKVMISDVEGNRCKGGPKSG